MGLMINRPSKFSLYELLVEIGTVTAQENKDQLLNTQVYEGGPVANERGFVLHSSETNYAGTQTLGEGLAISSSIEALQEIAQGRSPESYLLALGYAGWGAGQLEAEIQNNIWLTAPGDMKLMFNTESEHRLEAAAALLGMTLGDLALMASPGHA